MKLKINRKLLPIKGHYFFFMAALGPILPQLQVYGKELGISSVVMGTVTGILPIIFLLAKPAFGLVIDVYRNYRKVLFMGMIFLMGLFYSLLYFIPTRKLEDFRDVHNFCSRLEECNPSMFSQDVLCSSTRRLICSTENDTQQEIPVFLYYDQDNGTRICSSYEKSVCFDNLTYTCLEEIEIDASCMYVKWEFWTFLVLMCLGTIAFNVTNSVSDAICFDVIGEEYDYGKQRVWGTIGFGVTALIAGNMVNLYSDAQISYTPAFVVMIVCIVLDLISCIKLELPVIPRPENIFKDLLKLLKNRHTTTFVTFAVFAGIIDGFIVYFLFWYLEDLAAATKTSDIKRIEGFVVAAETLGGEVLFFSIAGKIIERFGHATCFSMCFLFYALRLALISVAPNPWWVVLIEFGLQGPTYALTYTTIVAYANAIAPPGASATMQGIAAGMDDGFGYAIGSLVGGTLYKYIGDYETFQIFALFALSCSISHVILHKTLLQNHEPPQMTKETAEYKSPLEAAKVTESI